MDEPARWFNAYDILETLIYTVIQSSLPVLCRASHALGPLYNERCCELTPFFA